MSEIVQLRPATRVLLTKQNLAAHLDRSPRWVELRVREGMPVCEGTDRFGRRRYDLGAVEAWLAEGRPKMPADRVGALEREVASLRARIERLEGRWMA